MRLLFALLAILLSAPLPAQDAFDEVPVPVFLDSNYRGELTALIDADGTVFVEPGSLVSLVQATLSDDVLSRAAELFRTDDPVRLREFSALGISVEFDMERLAVVVEIPPLARRTRTLSLAGVQTPPSGSYVGPSELSVIANLDLWTRLVYEDVLFEVSATPEIAVRASGIVVEVQGGVRTGDDPFFLNHLRLVWDVPEIGYRVEAGDLTWRNTELDSVSRITGLSLSREYLLSEPQRLTNRVLDRFFLAEQATIEVYVNESRLQRRQLAAGNYELSGVPLGDGVNTLVVVWRENETRLVELVIPYDSELLVPGELDAGVAVGVANRDVFRPVMVAYQSYGVSPEFTVGARQGFEPLNLQIDFGLRATLATVAGTFLLEPDIGIGPDDRLVIDVPLRYSYLNSTPSSYLSFGLTAGYRSAFGSAGGAASQIALASGYMNVALPDGFSVTPRVSYEYGLHDGSHLVDTRATLRRSIRGGSAVSGDIGFSWDGDPRFYATVTFSAAFPDAQQNLFLQQNLESQEFSAYWARYTDSDDPGVNYSLSTRVPIDLAQNATLSGQIGYGNRLFEGSLAHGVSGVVATGSFRNATSIALQSGIVFTEGVFAVTRPVLGSFALVVPGSDLSADGLSVEHSGQEVQGLSGGVAVLPGLGNYSPAGVSVSGGSVLFGMEEGDLTYAVHPAYRSGSLIIAQPEPSVYVAGTLVDGDDDAVPLVVGTYTDESGEATSFFTDEEGAFELYGLTPGRYEIRLPQAVNSAYEFVIPEDAREFVELGVLSPGQEEAP
jgi:hypothetical protein